MVEEPDAAAHSAPIVVFREVYTSSPGLNQPVATRQVRRGAEEKEETNGPFRGTEQEQW